MLSVNYNMYFYLNNPFRKIAFTVNTCIVISVDSTQIAQNVVSDEDLHCLQFTTSTSLAHFSLKTSKRVIDKQCRHRSDAAECDV